MEKFTDFIDKDLSKRIFPEFIKGPICAWIDDGDFRYGYGTYNMFYNNIEEFKGQFVEDLESIIVKRISSNQQYLDERYVEVYVLEMDTVNRGTVFLRYSENMGSNYDVVDEIIEDFKF
ncbi:MAG: hypothetical protein K6E54_11555 [Bacteroidaceae bacterium]|nr:hypothetical protein [Bacteroidaceae bacterium]